MSETVRTYSGNAQGLHPWTIGRRRLLRRITLLTLGILVIAGWWITRDSYPIRCFIPSADNYHIFAKNFLTKRSKLAESKVWQVVPETFGVGNLPELLKKNLGMPGWVLNNLVPDVCHASGRDLRGFNDVVFLSRMTRLGSLVAKCDRLIPGVDRDPSGGLALNHVRAVDVYFAVRGRVLLVSRSRDALIRAVTLRPEDSVSEETVDRWLSVSAAEDLHGTLALGPRDPLGGFFQGISFALRVDPSALRVKTRAVMSPEWQARMKTDIGGLEPKTMYAPPEGMLQLSMDLGLTIQDLWRAAARMMNRGEQAEQMWTEWSTVPAGGAPGLPQVATALFGGLGPGLRASWAGVDLNEMAPVPELVVALEGAPKVLSNVLQSVPPPPPGAKPWDMYPRYDPNTKQLHLPLIGGPSMEPTAGVYGNALLVSSSRTVAETLLQQGPRNAPLDPPGNLYVRIKPHACLEALVNTAALLAENNLLKDYTMDKLQADAAPWLAGAALISEVSGFAAYGKGEVTAELSLVCIPD